MRRGKPEHESHYNEEKLGESYVGEYAKATHIFPTRRMHRVIVAKIAESGKKYHFGRVPQFSWKSYPISGKDGQRVPSS